MGRPRKPQLDLVLQGTARPDRMAAQGRVSEPDLLALTDAPPPPKGLSREAGAHWRQQATLLVARRVLTEGDLVALEAWSRAAGLLCQADREIQRDGILVAGPRGGRYPHPAIGVRRAAAAEVYRWTAAFGDAGGAPERGSCG